MTTTNKTDHPNTEIQNEYHHPENHDEPPRNEHRPENDNDSPCNNIQMTIPTITADMMTVLIMPNTTTMTAMTPSHMVSVQANYDSNSETSFSPLTTSDSEQDDDDPNDQNDALYFQEYQAPSHQDTDDDNKDDEECTYDQCSRASSSHGFFSEQNLFHLILGEVTVRTKTNWRCCQFQMPSVDHPEKATALARYLQKCNCACALPTEVGKNCLRVKIS